MSTPSPAGESGRDGKGRFAAGNRAGKGNPNHAKVARLRQAILDSANPKQVVQVLKAMHAAATGPEPDVFAARVFLEYTVGKPTQPIEAEGIAGITVIIKEADSPHGR